MSSSDIVEVEYITTGGGTERRQLDHQLTQEEESASASSHALRASRNPGITTSSSSATSNVAQLGSREWRFDLGSPGRISGPQPQSTTFSGGFGAGLPSQQLRPNKASTLEQEEEGEEQTIAETIVEAATALALAQVSGKKSVACLSPAEMMTGNDWPHPPPSPGTTMPAESAAAAAVVVNVKTETEVSLVLSPRQQAKASEKSPAVGARVAAALTAWVPDDGRQSGHSPGSKSGQRGSRSRPQSPTPVRQPEKEQTQNEARSPRVSPSIDDGETIIQPRRADEKGQERRSTVNVTSTCSMNHNPVGGAAIEGRGRQPVTVAASSNKEPEANDEWRERRTVSEATAASSMKSVVDKMAAAVAEAKDKTRRNNRSSFGFRHISASSVGSRVGPRAASVDHPQLVRFGPRLAALRPANRQAKATYGGATGGGIDRPGRTERTTRGASDSYLEKEEKYEEMEIQVDVEAATEVWERVMREGAPAELDGKRETTQIATLAKGMTTLVEAVGSGDPSAFGAVVDTLENHDVAKQLSALRTNGSGQLETIPMLAIRSGDVEMFHAVLRPLRRTLTEWQVADVLQARGQDECSLLTAAAEGGNEAAFVDALALMGGKDKVCAGLSKGEACCLMKMAAKSGSVRMFHKAKEAVLLRGKRAGSVAMDAGDDPNKTSIVVEAARSGSGAMVDEVVAAMSDLLTAERAVAGLTSCAGPRRMSALMVAAESGSLEAVTAVMKALSTIGVGTKAARKMIAAKDVNGMTALPHATNSGVMEIIATVSALMSRYLSTSKMLDVYSTSLAKCCADLATPVDHERLKAVSYLLQHGAKPGALDLTRLSTSVPFPLLKATLLGAVSSAKNPFIPGMNLSVVLTMASTRAVEGEKRALLSMQAAVDELLLEVLEHLPQTVRGVEGEMKTCSAVFEPETVISGQEGTVGPLGVALQKRRQMDTYCTIPLVLDFMWRKFTKGLPTLRDTEGVLDTDKEFSNPEKTLYGDGMLADSGIPFLRKSLQIDYGNVKLSSFTYFPGARFIVVGLLSRPSSYYKVPALRMVLDLVTYLCMMTLFAGFVLLNDDNRVDWAEIVFGFYICGAIVREFREIAEDPWEYVLDRWNVLDVTCLCLMFASLVFRVFDSTDLLLARSLYALSAPLAFTRVLFFAQIHPSYGPMIQVLFSMTSELVKFGVVMLVVMAGFVMSFYSLFRRQVTFGLVWLNAFKAMLGETYFFDDFSGSVFDTIATVLLVAYLVILTIMMLNLLVAVLTTAHAKVDSNADQEYKVSKARLIQHYVSMVKIDRLPAPFNLLQWVFSCTMLIVDWCCCTTLHKHGKRFVGRAVFWAILGPIAVVTGWLLWVASAPKTVTVVWRSSAGNTLGRKLAKVTLAVASCTVGAPFWLLVLWVKGGFTGIRSVVDGLRSPGGRVCSGGEGRAKTARASRPLPLSERDCDATRCVADEGEAVVTAMLNEEGTGLGVGELQRYLDDPMSDPTVRHDEETRATTVEHVKLLRNRLEATTKDHINDLQFYLVRATENLSRQVKHAAAAEAAGGGSGRITGNESGPRELANIVTARFSELDREFNGRTMKLEERMRALLDKRLGVLSRKLDLVIETAAE